MYNGNVTAAAVASPGCHDDDDGVHHVFIVGDRRSLSDSAPLKDADRRRFIALSNCSLCAAHSVKFNARHACFIALKAKPRLRQYGAAAIAFCANKSNFCRNYGRWPSAIKVFLVLVDFCRNV